MPSQWDELIEKHARRVGIDPAWMRRIMQVESGGQSSNRTGSYKGLFQLSDREFKAHGGGNNIYDPEQNTMAAANKLAAEKLRLGQRLGRDVTLKDLYMVHQQGEAGYAAHTKNPDAPAWKNMASTGEGKQRGEAWAKKAIWGNIPDNLKAKYGSVENVTSRQFTEEVWGAKMEGKGSQARGSTGEYKAKWHRSRTGEEPMEPEAAAKPRTLLGGGDIDYTTDFHTPNIATPNIQLPRIGGSVAQIAKRAFAEG
jgi:transglycosylase-like protein with SLT domain